MVAKSIKIDCDKYPPCFLKYNYLLENGTSNNQTINDTKNSTPLYLNVKDVAYMQFLYLNITIDSLVMQYCP